MSRCGTASAADDNVRSDGRESQISEVGFDSSAGSQTMKLLAMKSLFPLLIVLGALALLGRAADSPQAQVIQIDHEKVAAAFAKGEGLLATNNFKIQAGQREVAGEVEVHDSDTDIFYILEGSATFVTGGNPVEARTVAPGETRAREIVGGQARELVKGDIIVIPTRVPHWFKEVRGPLLYYVVKVSK